MQKLVVHRTRNFNQTTKTFAQAWHIYAEVRVSVHGCGLAEVRVGGAVVLQHRRLPATDGLRGLVRLEVLGARVRVRVRGRVGIRVTCAGNGR